MRCGPTRSSQPGAKPDEVRAAIKKQAVARGRLIGTFRRG